MRVTDEMVEPLRALLLSAKVLHQNAEGCAVNHYGSDFEIHGLPGWLADCQRDIKNGETALAALEAALAVGGTPKVKALEWKKDWRGDLDDIPTWRAETPVGRLSFSVHGYASHDAAPIERTEAAKAEVQADYEKRVLSCLEYTTPPAGIREALEDWRPVAELHQDGDDTYLVTIEQTGKTASNKGARFVEKAWICPAENSGWLDPEGKDIEIAGWRVVSFKSWPEPDTALRGQS